MDELAPIMHSENLFHITPLLYDEQLQCASFDLQLDPAVSATTHDLDLRPLFEHYPRLRSHRCDSGHHRSFFDEARQTETAHLLEHIAVELLALSGVPRDRARGETGIPRTTCAEGQPTYRLRFYGADSLEQMDKLLRQAVGIFVRLVLEN